MSKYTLKDALYNNMVYDDETIVLRVGDKLFNTTLDFLRDSAYSYLLNMEVVDQGLPNYYVLIEGSFLN